MPFTATQAAKTSPLQQLRWQETTAIAAASISTSQRSPATIQQQLSSPPTSVCISLNSSSASSQRPAFSQAEMREL